MTKSCRFWQLPCDGCGSLWDIPEPGPCSTSSTACVTCSSASLQETAFLSRSPAGSSQPCPVSALPGAGISPSLRLLPMHLSPVLTMLGGHPLCARGDAGARYLHRRNCEGILHSSVPVSLIQHYRVLGKGAGAIALPSPSFDHCVILFFYTNCV